jgi:hypothetical protein
MQGFTTDVQIIPARAMLTPGTIVQPSATDPILSSLPGKFSISEDTARLIATIAPHLLRLAA